MTEFEQEVSEALNEIPHSDDCGIVPGMPGGRVHECTCDIDERRAIRVAAAIEMAASFSSDTFFAGVVKGWLKGDPPPALHFTDGTVVRNAPGLFSALRQRALRVLKDAP